MKTIFIDVSFEYLLKFLKHPQACIFLLLDHIFFDLKTAKKKYDSPLYPSLKNNFEGYDIE